jgi:branched-chain amino acid transport system ATP-binding protein
MLGSARIDGLAPFTIARQGVGRTFQVAATFASMTVRENAIVALRAYGLPADDADPLLARVGCADIADAHCAALAYGDAKRLELALALAGKPRLLLMDEPTAGMSPSSRARLMRVASDLARLDRIAVLFTEHDMDVVFAFADRVIVLDHGRIIADGTPAHVRSDPLVQSVYLGES